MAASNGQSKGLGKLTRECKTIATVEFELEEEFAEPHQSQARQGKWTRACKTLKTIELDLEVQSSKTPDGDGVKNT